MNILNPFKKKKNRRFNYTPRYYSGKSIGNIYDFDSKFYKYRETFNSIDFREKYSGSIFDSHGSIIGFWDSLCDDCDFIPCPS